MYLGWCLKEPHGWMPPVNLKDETEAWRYALLHGGWTDEVRITDLDESCVIHVKDQEVVFPGLE